MRLYTFDATFTVLIEAENIAEARKLLKSDRIGKLKVIPKRASGWRSERKWRDGLRYEINVSDPVYKLRR